MPRLRVTSSPCAALSLIFSMLCLPCNLVVWVFCFVDSELLKRYFYALRAQLALKANSFHLLTWSPWSLARRRRAPCRRRRRERRSGGRSSSLIQRTGWTGSWGSPKTSLKITVCGNGRFSVFLLDVSFLLRHAVVTKTRLIMQRSYCHLG